MGSRAASDIGSNSVRLPTGNQAGAELCSEMHITRLVVLAEGVDKTGELAASAIQRTQIVLERYAGFLAFEQFERLRVTGTSAARDARNREVFFERVRQAVGSAPELLSGEQAAALAFVGATHGRNPAAGPFVTLDIGGGSQSKLPSPTTSNSAFSLWLRLRAWPSLPGSSPASKAPTPIRDEAWCAELDRRDAEFWLRPCRSHPGN